MTEHSIVLAVAAYGSTAAAEQDFNAVRWARESGVLRHVAAAVLKKGAGGALGIHRSDSVAADGVLDGALLGAALAVLAAPVGISFLQPVATTPVAWARTTALVDHLWQNVPQEELHQMTNMLESSPAGLVVVAVDQTGDYLGALLSGATATIMAHSAASDLGADITRTTDDDPHAAN
jgi:uncharacterized membrane protein